MNIELNTHHEQDHNDSNSRLQHLSRELQNFANLDPTFKNGRSDYNCIEVTSADRMDPEIPVSNDHIVDDEVPGVEAMCIPNAMFTFKFEANRIRYYVENSDRTIESAHLQFILSVIGINANVTMPEHFAEELLSMPGREAARELGPVTLKATTMFSISPSSNHFAVCDKVEYLDIDDCELLELPCSCENNCITYVPEYEADDEEVHTPSFSDPDTTQYPSLDLYQKSINEVITYNDIQNATSEWHSMAEVGTYVDQMILARRIERASVALYAIQNAIWTKSGMPPRQQKLLRKQLKYS